MKKAKYFFSLFLRAELRKGIWVLALAFLVALFEIIGVASIMPFFAIIGNPKSIQTNKTLHSIYNTFHFKSSQEFILALGVAMVVFIFISNFIRAFSVAVNNRYISVLRHSLQSRLLISYISQPYRYFLHKNTSELSKVMWNDTDCVISYVVTPFLQMATNIILLVFVTLFISIVQLKIALSIFSFVAVITLIFILFVKRKRNNSVVERGVAMKSSYITLNEVLGGIKDVKVFQTEESFITRFSASNRRYGQLWAKSATFSQTPKFLLESIAFGSLIAITLVILYTYNGDMGLVLPILVLYAFAGYKIIPAVQIIFVGIASLKQGWPSVGIIHDDLALVEALQKHPPFEDDLHFNHELKMQDVSFRYAGSERNILNHINLSIPCNSTIGIVGGTGAGKTTLIDILLGLHESYDGKILSDDVVIDGTNVGKWKEMIGYVPQTIFLTDASIAENIAFGQGADKIDMKEVVKAAETAKLHDFINNELPEGYQTIVGERGVRLSGGQRQRLGIARALYRNPRILILDEATSALDNQTESFVMEALELFKGHCTILIVAHRLTTIQNCDKIIVLQQGEITSEGSYDELRRNSKEFQELSLIK